MGSLVEDLSLFRVFYTSHSYKGKACGCVFDVRALGRPSPLPSAPCPSPQLPLPYTPSLPPPAHGHSSVPSYSLDSPGLSLPAHPSLPAPGLLDSLRLGLCGMCLLTNLREEHFPGAVFDQKGVEIVG